MKVRVENKTPPSPMTIEDILEGECFRYQGIIFIKLNKKATEESKYYNALGTPNATLHQIPERAEVTPLESFLTVKEIK